MGRVRHTGGLESIATAGSGGGGALEFVAAATTSATSGTTLTVAAPTGTQKGDLMVTVVTASTGSSSATASSPGWLLVAQDQSAPACTFIFIKFAGNSEGGSVFTTTSSINRASAAVLSYRRTGGFQFGSLVVATSGTTVAASEITPTFAGKLLAIYAASVVQASITTPPSGMTLRASVTATGNGLAVYEQDAPADVATGTKSVTFPSSGRIAGMLLQIHER